MQTHYTKATVGDDGSLIIEKLPFSAGESVEVLVYASQKQVDSAARYPLRGKPVEFEDPTTPIAESDWEAPK